MNHHEPHETTPQKRPAGNAGHGWMTIACCIPMLAISVALVATGVVGVGFIFGALVCTALMMRGMSHGDGGEADRR